MGDPVTVFMVKLYDFDENCLIKMKGTEDPMTGLIRSINYNQPQMLQEKYELFNEGAWEFVVYLLCILYSNEIIIFYFLRFKKKNIIFQPKKQNRASLFDSLTTLTFSCPQYCDIVYLAN